MGIEDGWIADGELPYEDLKSFKIDLSNHGYTKKCRQLNIEVTTDGGSTPIELEALDGVTIAEIGKTEIEIKVSIADGDDGDYADETLTIHYLDADLVQHSAVCTMTDSMDTTAVAFTPAVTDFYCFDTDHYTPEECVVSSIEIKTGDTLIVHTTGNEAIIWATISAGKTTSTDAQMFGVGTIYGRAETDNALYDGQYLTLDYLTPTNKLVEGVTMVFEDDASDEGRFINARGYYVNDFYRRRTLISSVAPEAGKNMVICDSNMSNIYGVIQPAYKMSIHSKWRVRDEDGWHTYLARVKTQYQVDGEACTLTVSYIAKNIGSIEHPIFSKDGHVLIYEPKEVELEPGSDITFVAVDDGATGGVLATEITIIEAFRRGT